MHALHGCTLTALHQRACSRSRFFGAAFFLNANGRCEVGGVRVWNSLHASELSAVEALASACAKPSCVPCAVAMAHRHKRRKTDDVDAASPTMVNCLASWLELAAGSGSTLATRAARDASCPRADEMMMARLQINLQRSFDPNLADEAFAQAGAGTDPSGPPQWLRGILRSQQGRRLLAALASQHPECRLLSFATAASAPSAAAGSAAAAGGLETEDLESFLKRFGDCVTDVLDMVKKSQRAPSPGDEGANDALCKLCELCSATDFTLVYGLHLLRVADARGSKQTDQVATSARRLAQDVYHWASTGGMSSRVVHSALSANRSETASPGQHLLLCGRGMLQEREHGVDGLLASMEASGVASVGEAERLFASLKRQVNTEDRWSSATQLLQSLRSRAFLGAMLTALFNPVRLLSASLNRARPRTAFVICASMMPAKT